MGVLLIKENRNVRRHPGYREMGLMGLSLLKNTSADNFGMVGGWSLYYGILRHERERECVWVCVLSTHLLKRSLRNPLQLSPNRNASSRLICMLGCCNSDAFGEEYGKRKNEDLLTETRCPVAHTWCSPLVHCDVLSTFSYLF